MRPQVISRVGVPADNETRASYAKMVTRLLNRWQLPSSDQLSVLGMNEESRTTLARYREGKPLANTRDLMDRVAYLFDIHAKLRLIFPHNQNLVYGWMSARVADFDNKTPVELVKLHGIVGLNMLCSYLEKVLGE